MLIETGITINSTDITGFIAEGGVKWSRNDIDGKNAGRDLSGTEIRDRLCTKIRLDIRCRKLTYQELQTLLTALYPEFVTVHYCREGGRYRPAPRISSRPAVDTGQLQFLIGKVRLLLQLAGSARLYGLSRFSKAARQSKASHERVSLSSDHQQIDIISCLAEYQYVRCQRRLLISFRAVLRKEFFFRQSVFISHYYFVSHDRSFLHQ